MLLGQREPIFDEPDPNEAPLDARSTPRSATRCDFALSARDVALIHGPPGTGKTTTVVELIRRAVRRGEKVLACGPSNMAVDNLFERLLAHGERVVRLGHPARVMPELRAHTLDLLVERHEDVRLARKLVKDAWRCFAARRAPRGPSPSPARGAKCAARPRALLGRRAAAGGAGRRAHSRHGRHPVCHDHRVSTTSCWAPGSSTWS